MNIERGRLAWRGAERRLRRGEAALAFCVLLPAVPEDVATLPLLKLELVPVASRDHPLAGMPQPVRRADLEEHVQLVLSDPAARDGSDYGVVPTRSGVSSNWRAGPTSSLPV